MKPFDLQRAIAGDPLVTRDGRQVTDFHYFSTARMDCPVIAVIGTELMTYTTEGRWGGPASPADLFMAPQKRTVFLNLHKQRDTGDIAPFLYADEAYAKRQCGNSMNCLGTFPIEIED